MTDEPVAEKLAERWRMMCPEHHHRLVDQVGPTVYCEGCGHAYRYEDLVDKREAVDHRRVRNSADPEKTVR